jgi:hypothetical protein
VAETLRARAIDPDLATGRQEPGDPVERDRQEQERDRELEDDLSDTWCTYRSAPTTSARPTAGGCRSHRRGPNLGCRWVATTMSPTSPIGYGTGRVRSGTTTVRTVDLGCFRSSGKPWHRAGACRCPSRSC